MTSTTFYGYSNNILLHMNDASNSVSIATSNIDSNARLYVNGVIRTPTDVLVGGTVNTQNIFVNGATYFASNLSVAGTLQVDRLVYNSCNITVIESDTLFASNLYINETVGIGTSNPSTTLEVVGGITALGYCNLLVNSVTGDSIHTAPTSLALSNVYAQSLYASNTVVNTSNRVSSLSNYVYNNLSVDLEWTSNTATNASNVAYYSSNTMIKRTGDTTTGTLTINNTFTTSSNFTSSISGTTFSNELVISGLQFMRSIGFTQPPVNNIGSNYIQSLVQIVNGGWGTPVAVQVSGAQNNSMTALSCYFTGGLELTDLTWYKVAPISQYIYGTNQFVPRLLIRRNNRVLEIGLARERGTELSTQPAMRAVIETAGNNFNITLSNSTGALYEVDSNVYWAAPYVAGNNSNEVIYTINSNTIFTSARFNLSNTLIASGDVVAPNITTLSNLAFSSSNALYPQAAFGSNTAVFASNLAVTNSNALYPQALFGSNTAVFASNLAITTSNQATFASNLAVTNSNVLYPQALFGSNTAVFASNLSITNSNALYPQALFGSNTAVFASNLAITNSNALYPQALFGSNTSVFASNLAVSVSNYAYTLSGGGGGSNVTFCNLVFVDSLSDLPTPVGNVITLNSNVVYFFTTTVDLVGNRLVCGPNTSIQGTSSETARIKSTGLTNADLITSAYTLPIQNITIESGSDNNVRAVNLDATGSPAGQSLDWLLMNFTDCSNVGIIKNYGNFIFNQCSFLNSAGLSFDGTFGTIAINNSLISGRAAQTSITLLSTVTIQRRFRAIYSSFVAFGGGTAINVSTTATIPAEAYILDTINFSGGAIYTAGVQFDDLKAKFTNCVGVRNSTSIANMFVKDNVVQTATTAASNRVPILGPTSQISSSNIQRFLHNSTSNTLQYLSTIPKIFSIQTSLSFIGSQNNVLGFYIGINRDSNSAIDSNAASNYRLSESEIYITATGTRPDACFIQALATLSNNDRVFLIAQNTTAGNPLTVTQFNMIVSEQS